MRDYIRNLKRRLSAENNPYFMALRDGSMSREDFVETQIQFLFAVVFFSRPMAVLAARMPRPELRVSLFENVRDEHGDGNLLVSHEKTFLKLLGRFGVTAPEIESRVLWPEVRAFNTTLMGVCFNDDLWTGMATLGIIEDLFSGISAEIGRAIIDRGWLTESRVIHYATHEELDVSHAEGFYREIEGPWAQHARYRYQAQQGFELGGYIFLRMYEDLNRNRTRRWMREITGPHSLSDGWYLEDGHAPSMSHLLAAPTR